MGDFSDRTPLDWSEAQRYSGIQHLYRDLIRLRRNGFDPTRGLRGQHIHVHHVNHRDKVLAFHRWSEGGARDDVAAVINRARRSFLDGAGGGCHIPLRRFSSGGPHGGHHPDPPPV
jgi:1,4-alpha-glucan branching enzyme